MTCSHRTPIDAPSIETATDPIHSADDLRLRWLALMSPLGFSRPILWMAFVLQDRCLEKALTQFPAETFDDWMRVAETIVELGAAAGDMVPGTTVAFMRSRPGSEHLSDDDIHWADMVQEAAQRYGLPIEPFFRANDVSLVEVSVQPSS